MATGILSKPSTLRSAAMARMRLLVAAVLCSVACARSFGSAAAAPSVGVGASQQPSAHDGEHGSTSHKRGTAAHRPSSSDASHDAIEARFRELCYGFDPLVDPVELASKVVAGLPASGIGAEALAELMAETAAYQCSLHPDFGRLAARVAVGRLHEVTEPRLLPTLRRMHDHRAGPQGDAAALVTAELVAHAEAMEAALEGALRHELDFNYDYFGLRTLQRSYLKRARDGAPLERPQHMLMRVALCVHGDDEAAVLHAYDLMSRGLYTHATPTLFNAGAPRQQLSSCFLLTATADSIEGIFETLSRCALISRDAGGIGLSVSSIRAAESYIRSSGGRSQGLVPMLRVFDAAARYVDQGGGKRKGAFAVYLEPWHADVLAFLDLKKNHGKEEARARDLFYALWTPDLFMRRVEANANWSLFCPDEAPGLADVHGAAFDELYERYEREGRARRVVPAQQVWFKIIEAQMETGTPYMLYKDAANAKSNQNHLGTIKGSNLCTEIIEYTSPDEVAVCNLASIALPRFVRTEAAEAGLAAPEALAAAFDFEALRQVTRFVARSLDRVISATAYPLPQAEASNLRHRPVGIGVQGLADVFAMLRLPFDSPTAAALNRDIFETMYFGALEASCELAAELGAYQTFEGSPASRGLLQFDLWGVAPTGRWDWEALRARIRQHGLRNSLLMAPMPTASTAQILGNNECFEPMTSNLYARRTLAGEFFVLNQHLQRELQALGLWSRETRDEIMAAGGSVQGLHQLPSALREVYKTAWELKQRTLIDLAADRGAYIDQSQSLNLFLTEPTFAQVSSMHFHAWRRGLKTGMYYLRTQPAAEAIKFTLSRARRVDADADGAPFASSAADETAQVAAAEREQTARECAMRSGAGECEMCSS